ncbi:MAG TPA: ATP-binding cassette domain-containing protein, partial [Elusimicrobiota bacterium]|nr:ATP-binding cassette domain-containing protein [Elusimicrobiota bacterium]
MRHEYKNPGGPPRVALQGIDFEVSPGELFGVLGPNGGGKTTLFRILSTALRPTGGGACRARRTCADLTCDPGLTCVDSAPADAECRNTANCPAGEAPRVDGTGCVSCRITCTGRAGGTGQVYTALATQADVCICETMPGFFWDDGAPGGGDIRTCDADRDGWVRETA